MHNFLYEIHYSYNGVKTYVHVRAENEQDALEQFEEYADGNNLEVLYMEQVVVADSDSVI